MARSWDSSAVVERLAPAAFDSSQWMPALDRLVEAVGATGAGLIPFNVDDRPTGVMVTAGVAEAFDLYIKEGWYKHDLRARSIPKLLSTGIAVDLDITSPEEMRHSPYYGDLLDSQDLRWFVGVAFGAGDDKWCMIIQRSAEQGPFTTAEQNQLLTLRGSLTTAATIAQQLGSAHARGVIDAFEMTGTAAFLINRQAQVIRANNAAEAMLGKGLSIVNKQLMADDGQASVAIARLIWNAGGGTKEATRVAAPVTVPRAGCRPLVVYAIPLAGAIRDVFCAARAIVMVRDLDARPHPPETLLRMIFGLTVAETKLAVRMASGVVLETVADNLGRTYETARAQLKSVFAKTNTHRQAELVALLASLSQIGDCKGRN
jgi:DNA-binding CsgD family transcriptional regulator/PAS domain-containing protein